MSIYETLRAKAMKAVTQYLTAVLELRPSKRKAGALVAMPVASSRMQNGVMSLANFTIATLKTSLIREKNMKKKMLMTEPEAKDRSCPMGRGKPNLVPCIASDCMAWRWENWSASIKELDKFERWESIRGYCGLGGSAEPGIDGIS